MSHEGKKEPSVIDRAADAMKGHERETIVAGVGFIAGVLLTIFTIAEAHVPERPHDKDGK